MPLVFPRVRNRAGFSAQCPAHLFLDPGGPVAGQGLLKPGPGPDLISKYQVTLTGIAGNALRTCHGPYIPCPDADQVCFSPALVLA